MYSLDYYHKVQSILNKVWHYDSTTYYNTMHFVRKQAKYFSNIHL